MEVLPPESVLLDFKGHFILKTHGSQAHEPHRSIGVRGHMEGQISGGLL